jgi:NAD(P)-dependent dehydrogenase (short-subunit alcohol dehydrogenase family)
MKLQGKVALITGGGRGIGKSVAELFSQHGATLMLCARSAQELGKTRDELVKAGGRVEVFVADVSRTEDVRALVARTLEAFGKIDVLVNAAGTYGAIGAITTLDFAKWKATFAVNLFGTFSVIQQALPSMIEHRGGRIINFSGGGEGPLPNFSAYSTSKIAVVRLTENLAEELKSYGIMVNVVAPGAVNTKILDDALDAGKERVGADLYARFLKQKQEGGVSPLKAAELCVFLASDESKGLTGKFVSAIWDDWNKWDEKQIREIMATDRLTIRRKK